MPDIKTEFSKEIKILRKHETETMLEIKLLVSQTKSSAESLTIEWMGGDKISEYRDKVEELVRSIKDDNKYFKTHQLKVEDIWDTLEWPNQQILDTEELHAKGMENIFFTTTAKISPRHGMPVLFWMEIEEEWMRMER